MWEKVPFWEAPARLRRLLLVVVQFNICLLEYTHAVSFKPRSLLLKKVHKNSQTTRRELRHLTTLAMYILDFSYREDSISNPEPDLELLNCYALRQYH